MSKSRVQSLRDLVNGSKPAVRADEILYALAKKHQNSVRQPAGFFTQVRNGPTQQARRGELRIIDGLAIRKSWTHPHIIGYEVKVSRADFVGDTKWMDYLPMCHELYFACPSGLIKPEEVGDVVGLIWYNPETKVLTTRKKAVFRNIEIPWTMLWHIIMSHLDDDRHPFFSDQREKLQAWLEDKRSRRFMGYVVEGKLWQQLAEQEEEIEKLRRKLESSWDQPKKELEELKATLREAGINVDEWGWKRRLKELLERGVTAEIEHYLDELEQTVQRMRKTVSRTFASAVGGASRD